VLRRSSILPKTITFDVAEHLDTPESQAEILPDAFESGEAAYIAPAPGTVAPAPGVELIRA
jgi:DNA-binding phage protein